MNTLDDPALLALDASGMLDQITGLGAEFVSAWESAAPFATQINTAAVRNVVIAGMGGSAAAGDYFSALCAPSATVPIAVVRDYALPNYVSAESLVVLSSHSGETEETLSCYDDAWKRGAALAVITTGGVLARRAQLDGVPLHRFVHRGSPRSALAHGLAPLLRLGSAAEWCATDDAEVSAAAQRHRTLVDKQLGPAVPLSRNPAKQVAVKLSGRVVFVLGAEHLAAATRRFKNQIAETAKMLAAADELPEADHNLIAGLGATKPHARQTALLQLESQRYHDRTLRRCALTAGLFEGHDLPVARVALDGDTLLGELLQATAWSDFVSFYLALLNGKDPTPIPEIRHVREAMAGA